MPNPGPLGPGFKVHLDLFAALRGFAQGRIAAHLPVILFSLTPTYPKSSKSLGLDTEQVQRAEELVMIFM